MRKKVFLILDNLGVRHCKPVKARLTGQRNPIEGLYLPSDSLELNPGERLSADLRHAIGSRVPVCTKGTLRAPANDNLTLVEANPEHVESYFQDPRA